MVSAEDTEIVPVAPTLDATASGSSTSVEGSSEIIKDKLDSDITTMLLERYLDRVSFLSEVDYSNAINQLRDVLDEVKEETEAEDHYYKTVIGSAIMVSTGLSVGYVVWLIRGGMLLSSMLFSMPAWQLADPLPLLAGQGK